MEPITMTLLAVGGISALLAAKKRKAKVPTVVSAAELEAARSAAARLVKAAGEARYAEMSAAKKVITAAQKATTAANRLARAVREAAAIQTPTPAYAAQLERQVAKRRADAESAALAAKVAVTWVTETAKTAAAAQAAAAAAQATWKAIQSAATPMAPLDAVPAAGREGAVLAKEGEQIALPPSVLPPPFPAESKLAWQKMGSYGGRGMGPKVFWKAVTKKALRDYYTAVGIATAQSR